MSKLTDKLIVKTKHLDMYKTEKGFYYCQRRSLNSVAVLCYKKVLDEYLFLIRYQPMPQVEEKQKWTDLYPCPITGSIEKNETPLDCAIRETLEESGYLIEAKDLIQINPSIATTQMNEKVFCFLANVSNLKESKPKNDGTIFEAISKNVWITKNELEKIIYNDLFLSSLLICFYFFEKKVKN